MVTEYEMLENSEIALGGNHQQIENPSTQKKSDWRSK